MVWLRVIIEIYITMLSFTIKTIYMYVDITYVDLNILLGSRHKLVSRALL